MGHEILKLHFTLRNKTKTFRIQVIELLNIYVYIIAYNVIPQGGLVFLQA